MTLPSSDQPTPAEQYPPAPDGRYLVVRGRLWRAANPGLTREVRQYLVDRLMDARRAVAAARRSGEAATLRQARDQVNAAKLALGERGPVWWTDGAPDLNRHLVRKTPYANWFAERTGKGQSGRAAAKLSVYARSNHMGMGFLASIERVEAAGNADADPVGGARDPSRGSPTPPSTSA